MYEALKYFNFQRGGEVLEKIPCMGEVWIFSGTTQCLHAQSCVDIFSSIHPPKNNIEIYFMLSTKPW